MDIIEAEPQSAALNRAADVALVDVNRQDLDGVALGILHDDVRVIEAHRLVVEQPGVQRRRVMELEPGGLVAGAGEGSGMRLREAELREGRQLGEDLLGDWLWDLVGGAAVKEVLADRSIDLLLT